MKRALYAVLLLLLVALGVYKCSENPADSPRTRDKNQIIRAAEDTIRYSRDKYDRVVAEKRAIEGDLRLIQAQYAELSGNQRQLLVEIGHLKPQERKNLASATRIEQKMEFQAVDRELVPVYGADLAWKRVSDTLSYDIRVKDSVLTIHDLHIPNGLIVSTFRDKNADLHVQVTNTNPVYKTQDVDTIVPEKSKKRGWVVKVLLFLGGALVGGAAAR
jgi:hypothetical protein